MKNYFQLTDEAILKDLGNKITTARINYRLTQADASFEAGISKRTLERLEAGQSIQLVSFLRILRALNRLEEFNTLFPEPTISPMAQLQLGTKRRQRASKKMKPIMVEEAWTWRDKNEH